MTDDGRGEGTAWPLPKFHFHLDLGDGRPITFTEVGGLDSEAEPIEYRHGDSPRFSAIKMPGLKAVGNLTLKRGLVGSASSFWSWFNQARLGEIKRRTLTISLLDEAGSPAMVWTLTNAWPTRMTGAAPDSEGNEVAIESLEIAYETISVKTA